MMNAAISTILPTHNRAHLLGRVIVSVLEQLAEQDEPTVIDDGSTDDTKAVVSEFGSRLRSDSHKTDCAEARVKIIQRVWGEDKDFLKKHGELYRRVLDEQRLILADGLIVRGEIKKAREQLRKMSVSPLSRRLLAALPGNIVKGLLAARRTFINR